MCGENLHKAEEGTNGRKAIGQFVELTQHQKEFTFPPTKGGDVITHGALDRIPRRVMP